MPMITQITGGKKMELIDNAVLDSNMLCRLESGLIKLWGPRRKKLSAKEILKGAIFYLRTVDGPNNDMARQIEEAMRVST